MKVIKIIAWATMGLCLATTAIFAQNYKAPKIDALGKFTDVSGGYLGTVSKDGVMDAKGKKQAHIDSEGNLIDSKTGIKLGKAQKNGDFVYNFAETKDGKNFTVGVPSEGMCEVKNKKGDVVLLIHENYKAQAACAYHCAKMKKEGKEMKMK
jgi:hypothetical protein